jgi:hypothetical protein
MKRTFPFATLLGALVAAALVAGSASVVSAAAPQIPNHVGGVVPAIGKQVTGGGQLIWHGGPVMTTNKTYAIYWQPAGYSYGSGYTSTINQFFGDVAHDNGLGSNVYAIDTQYSSIQYSSTFGGSVTDTSAFPSSGCPLYEGDITECLTDAQIMAEINTVSSNQGWAKNGTNMFFLFTPMAVGSCFGSSASTCSYTAYCAYHGVTNGGAIYANQPYAKHSGCDEGQYPNGNAADPTINVTSHEHNEAITDPQLNAWYDQGGYEIGDKCAWDFGAVSGSSGSEYNQTINGHHYFLQREYSNSGSACLQTFNTGGGGSAPQITSFSPRSGRHGTFVTITGKNFTGTTAVTLLRGSTSYGASYSVQSSTQIRATVPTVPTGYARWKVTNPAGSATSAGSFYVTG